MQVKKFKIPSQFFGYKLEANSEIWRYFKKNVKMWRLETQKYMCVFSHNEISFNQIDKSSQKKMAGFGNNSP